MKTLTAKSDYGFSGQFVARITGRHSKFTFEREFVGSKGGKRNETTTANLDTPGLYEVRDVSKKGKRDEYTLLLIATDTGKLDEYGVSIAEAMEIAKQLDTGKAIESIVWGDSKAWEWGTAPVTAPAPVAVGAAATVEVIPEPMIATGDTEALHAMIATIPAALHGEVVAVLAGWFARTQAKAE